MDKKIIKLLKKLQNKHEEVFVHIRVYADESGVVYFSEIPIFDFENKKELKKQLKQLLKKIVFF